VKVLIDRKLVLREILQIEGKIKTMRRNPKYVKIKSSIFSLESRRFGSHMVSIAAPDDPETTIDIKNNSQEMRDTISRYKEMRTEFDDLLDALMARKQSLQRQLFERPQ
jgi:hypothetical protein